LIHPAPQFLSNDVDITQEAYIHHKESEGQKKYEIQTTFKYSHF